MYRKPNMPAWPWATISLSCSSSCQLYFFHSREASDRELKLFRGAFHHMWTYPFFYETFCLLRVDIQGKGRSGHFPAEWAETVGLPATFFCGSLSHSSLSQGGNDPGHSFHMGFKFLVFNQKDEDSYDDHVWAASPLHLWGLLQDLWSALSAWRTLGGMCRQLILAVCAHMWGCVSSLWNLHFPAFSAACACATLSISVVGDTLLL